MIPMLIDEPFEKFPLLWQAAEDAEEVDIVELFGCPARWVSCVAGDLVVVDQFDEEHVIYSAEWEARSIQRLCVKKILAATTDTEKYPDEVTNTATYVRLYL